MVFGLVTSAITTKLHRQSCNYCVGHQDLLLPKKYNIPGGQRQSGILHSITCYLLPSSNVEEATWHSTYVFSCNTLSSVPLIRPCHAHYAGTHRSLFLLIIIRELR